MILADVQCWERLFTALSITHNIYIHRVVIVIPTDMNSSTTVEPALQYVSIVVEFNPSKVSGLSP